MKIDCKREFDDAADAQQGSFAEGLTGTFKSVLNNPVLPSELDFFARGSGALSLTSIRPPQVNGKELPDEPNQPLSGTY